MKREISAQKPHGVTRLVLLHRSGLLVVCGTIVEIDIGKIVIENDVYLPVSGRTERKRIHLQVPYRKFKAMKFKVGAEVLATASDDDGLDVIADGGEIPIKEFHLMAYNVRYGGAFDFPEKDGNPEEHVFSGNVKDLAEVMVYGSKCLLITMTVRTKNENADRLLLARPNDWIRKGDRHIAVTSKSRPCRCGTIYPVRLLI